MRTITCTLTFTDGKTVTAKAAARLEDEQVLYQFSGEILRLPALPEKDTLGFLEWYMKGCATNFTATYEVDAEGDFEV